ncbi:PadR family transcriptional regulator [Streptomyces sp. NPDC101110]|uniref:PadR family transcriptional regulator n=1 Tax=unclassified Streptomyces TaxID=2593676 RepID=UPI0037F69424
MSIRHGLLALPAAGPRYGSRLRSDFEARPGGTRPLNIGQVCTTAGRLERDGMVARDDVDAAGRTLYALTETGRAEPRSRYERPVERAGRGPRPRAGPPGGSRPGCSSWSGSSSTRRPRCADWTTARPACTVSPAGRSHPRRSNPERERLVSSSTVDQRPVGAPRR